ncbi:MAG: phosphoribosylglycinamide formyltransferase [Burkholderiaceae bacterium]|nr:phosphoribosylglycinamide formyltransferase [Burkholderiaceae bacterium]
MKNVVVLISGVGSNMARIVDCCRDERWPARIAAVVSNRPDAAGLERARERGVPVLVVDHRDFDSRAAFDRALGDAVERHAPDWVALAGFMRVLGDDFVARFQGRLVNIHPSLLPAFTGLHTHRRALAAGVRVHGATVHLVEPALDSGPILAQAVVPVLDDDDEHRLARRVLAAEHRLYPAVLRWLIEGRLRTDGPRAVLRAEPGESLLLLPTETPDV